MRCADGGDSSGYHESVAAVPANGAENAMPELLAAAQDVGLPTRIGLRATLRKYVNIFRVSLVERMAYRGDFLLGTVLRFFPMITTILLWKAVFDGSGREELGGFRRRQMIAYLLLIHISRMFSSMPGLAGGISRDVREGTLKKYLLQPLDLIGYLVAYRAAHKCAYITTSFIPYACLFLVCAGYFEQFPDALTFAGYVAALLLGFVIGFFFDTCVGLLGFWFLEITSLLWVITTLSYFISGQMFPLDLLPPFWSALLKALPFQYLAYFPAVVFLGKVRGWDLVQGLLIGVMWAAAMVLLARWLYARGLRRYSAYGG
jgi:ABC-2 type transport system permease protein